MAAQEAGAFSPTPVTMPTPVIAKGKLLIIGIYTSPIAPSPEGEGRDEGNVTT